MNHRSGTDLYRVLEWSRDYSEEYIKATIQKFSSLPRDLLATACAFTGKQLQKHEENVPRGNH